MTSAHFTKSPRPRAVALAAACLACALPAQALMIAVYAPQGSGATVEDLKVVALALKENREAVVPEGYSAKLADEAVLTAEFSVPAGASAYFWADETFSRSGYVMGGEGAHYEAEFPEEAALAKEALDVERPAPVFATALRRARAGQGSLTLDYSVAEPGRVKVEAVGVNGQRFGAWTFTEAAAGAFERSLTLNRAVEGPFYVRWTHGNVQAVRKVVPTARQR